MDFSFELISNGDGIEILAENLKKLNIQWGIENFFLTLFLLNSHFLGTYLKNDTKNYFFNIKFEYLVESSSFFKFIHIGWKYVKNQ